jgi:SWI/SNF-related matrix-associated actin-dependent regulator of chromatin subfamily A member 5
VLDEGHRIKNAETDISARVAALGGMWRVILTGTPIQNNLSEVWGLLRWLYPTIFTPPTGELFAKAFALSKGQYVEKIMTAVTKLLGTVLLRRTKTMLGSSGELTDVPPREEWTVFLPFTEAQRFWTYKLLTRLDAVDLKEIFPDIHSADKRMDKENIKVEEEDGVDDGRREVLQFLENHAKGGSSNRPSFLLSLRQGLT